MVSPVVTSNIKESAYLDSMAHLTTVATLDFRPVLGLRAVTREMAHLLAVAAGDSVWVTRLITFLGDMVCRTAVATGASSNVGTLKKISNDSSPSNVGTYIFGEMASLVALAALNALCRTRLRTLLGIMALLLAVLARKRIEALLGAVAGTVTFLFTVDADHGSLVGFMLDDLFLAALEMC